MAPLSPETLRLTGRWATLIRQPPDSLDVLPRRPRTLPHVEDLRIDASRLAEVCRRYGIARPEVFGSVARGEQRPDSDVDLLYTLEGDARSAGRSRISPSP